MTRYFASDPTELGHADSARVWRGREISLMRRADNGHWGLPGSFVELGEPTTPEETLESGFFAADALPKPFVPIHRVRIEDGLAGNPEAAVR